VDEYELKERIEKTEYLVEADHDHTMFLWEEWSKDAHELGSRDPYNRPRLTWEQMNPGCVVQVGALDERPVMLSLAWVKIGGALICFYYGMSQVVDHLMIEKYLDATFKGVPRTDVANFGHAVEAIQRRDPDNVVEIEESKRPFGREALEAFQNDGILTTRLMTDFAIEDVRRERRRSDPATHEVMVQLGDIKQRLDDAVKKFAEHVWAAWLKGYYREQGHRGLEANAGNVNVLVWGVAGRVMISLRRRDGDDDSLHVTLIGADSPGDTDSLGLQGINFHCEMAVQLVQEAAVLGPSIETDIRPNEKVGMG
jgi:hypothetical protein